MSKVRIGYKDGSGPEYITVDGTAVLAVRWGCSCCKNTVDKFEDLNAAEKELMKRVVAYLSRRNPKKKKAAKSQEK